MTVATMIRGTLICLLASTRVDTAGAEEIEIRDCPDELGIEALYPPFEKHARTFYNGQVSVFNTDTIEPAARSKGIALTIPDDENAGVKCIYVGPFSSVSDVSDARTSYDASKGLLIELKTGEYGPRGPTKPSEPLRLRINLQAGTVSRE